LQIESGNALDTASPFLRRLHERTVQSEYCHIRGDVGDGDVGNGATRAIRDKEERLCGDLGVALEEYRIGGRKVRYIHGLG
jgi:hypothetical protein